MKHVLLSSTLALGILVAPTSLSAQEMERRVFTPEDVHRLRDVGDLAMAPDGNWVAYTVRTTDRDLFLE